MQKVALALAAALLLLLNGPVYGKRRRKASLKPAAEQAPPSMPDRETLLKLRPIMEKAERLETAGRKEEAAGTYLEAIDIFPEFDMAHFNLALTLEEMGQFRGASTHYHRTLQLLSSADPRKFEVLTRLGQLTSRLAGADNPQAHVQAASQPPTSVQQQEALQLAHKYLSEALSLNPDHAASHLSEGKVLSALAMTTNGSAARQFQEESVHHFRRASELEPVNPATLVELGLALHRSDGVAEATAVLSRALKLADPPKGVAPSVAAEFHTQLGLRLRSELPRFARRHFEASLRLDPVHAQARTAAYHLGRLIRLEAKGAGGGSDDAEQALYTQACDAGLWKHPMQRPGYLAAGVKTMAGPWPSAAQWPNIEAAIMALEAGHATILAELQHSLHHSAPFSAGKIAGSRSSAPIAQSGASWGVEDLEGLTDAGRWFQRIYRRNGILHPDAHDADKGGCALRHSSTSQLAPQIVQQQQQQQQTTAITPRPCCSAALLIYPCYHYIYNI